MSQVIGDNLLHQQLVKRTREALQAQDEAFEIEYETASDADLIDYVRRCVDVSYTPAPCEVVRWFLLRLTGFLTAQGLRCRR